MSFCPKCGYEYLPDSVFCQRCGFPLRDAQTEQVAISKGKQTNVLWWLAPLFLLIVGGVLAYRANRSENLKTARKQLVLGIVMTIAVPVCYLLYVFVSKLFIGLP